MVDLAHKGKVYPAFEFTIERGKVNEFVLAIDDPNPVYQDESPPLPPTFATVLTFWGGANLAGYLAEIGVEIFNVLHAEQEYAYFVPLNVGDTITGQTKIEDIYFKEGRSGKMEFVQFETEFKNQHGELAIKDRALIIVRG
jgi:hypothetical protein